MLDYHSASGGDSRTRLVLTLPPATNFQHLPDRAMEPVIGLARLTSIVKRPVPLPSRALALATMITVPGIRSHPSKGSTDGARLSPQ
jgi:hypothetical protein